jgi:hypothetical protein
VSVVVYGWVEAELNVRKLHSLYSLQSIISDIKKKLGAGNIGNMGKMRMLVEKAEGENYMGEVSVNRKMTRRSNSFVYSVVCLTTGP